MKTSLLLYAFLSLLLVSSCKEKEDDASPNDPQEDFIEFKIDGTQYRINQTGYTATGASTAEFIDKPDLPNYHLSVLFVSPAGATSRSVLMGMGEPTPLTLKTYHNLPIQGQTIVFLTLLPNSFSYVMHHGSEATLTLAHLDKAKGSKVEGTFSIDRLDYKNANHDVVSSNHKLTDGKFKVTVNQ
jgi:hypothetical protein